jgi:Protein of unknown function (DUF3341)
MGGDAPRLVAAFGSSKALETALVALRSAGVDDVVTYTPTPVRAATDVSPAGLAGAVAGLVGAAGAFAMQVYANVWGYPLDIGGRPKFSWPSFVPIALEVGILLAVLGIFICVFVTAPLLRLYAPIDDCDLIRRSTSDRWVVVVSSSEPRDLIQAHDICARLGALEIEDSA